MFVKGGLGFLGANLVILPLLGERVFPLSLQGLGSQRAAMLGMSVLMAARGLGALLGPLLTVPWARQRDWRLRLGILFGFLAIFFGYVALGMAPTVWIACLAPILAHGGGSTIWVFSTTLLQKNTDDRFRGRVFSADMGLNTLMVSVTSYLAGMFMDRGVGVRDYALVTGISVLAPAVAWALALRLWNKEPVVNHPATEPRP
jgi:MFS family permease